MIWATMNRAGNHPLNGLLKMPMTQAINSKKIVATAMDVNDEEVSEEEENHCPVTHADACTAFDTALKYLQSQNTDPAHLLLVKNWRETAARK